MSAKAESYVLFELAGSVYGLPCRSVQHIEMLEHVTLVPNANPAIEGVVFSRGHLFPALNLRLRFGFPRAENTIRTRIIFATVHDRTVGLIVDTAREFKNLAHDSIRPITETLSGINGQYLKAVTTVNERLVLILDLEAILKVDEVQMPPSVPVDLAQTATT